LGKGVSIETHVDTSFGLEIYLSVIEIFETAREVIMENSNEGMCLVRSCVPAEPGGKLPTQTRDRCV
jgi:hypothetical protein